MYLGREDDRACTCRGGMCTQPVNWVYPTSRHMINGTRHSPLFILQATKAGWRPGNEATNHLQLTTAYLILTTFLSLSTAFTHTDLEIAFNQPYLSIALLFKEYIRTSHTAEVLWLLFYTSWPSLIPRPLPPKSGLVFTVCGCVKYSMKSWGIVLRMDTAGLLFGYVSVYVSVPKSEKWRQ